MSISRKAQNFAANLKRKTSHTTLTAPKPPPPPDPVGRERLAGRHRGAYLPSDPHEQHGLGLIQHDKCATLEGQDLGLDVMDQPPGGSHEHIHPRCHQGGGLDEVVHPPEHSAGAHSGAQVPRHIHNLPDELLCGREDQGCGPLVSLGRRARLLLHVHDGGEEVGQCLAAPSLSDADTIVPREQHGPALGLERTAEVRGLAWIVCGLTEWVWGWQSQGGP